jgi:hypothetical protein
MAVPIRKSLAEVLGGIQKAFGKKIWEMPKDQFVREIQEQQHRGFYLSTNIGEADVQKSLDKVKRIQQRELGEVAPGFHYFEEKSGKNAYWVYNTAMGEVAGFGSMSGGVRGEIMVAKPYRGRGEQGIAHRISRQMFMSGAIESPTLSTAGAKAYHKQVVSLAQEAGLDTASTSSNRQMVTTNAKMAAAKVHAAQPQGTPNRIAKSINGQRGSRNMPSGGNG